jgi:oligoendopeptidase F
MEEIKAQDNRLLKRSEIDQKYKWNLSDLYQNWDEWSLDYEKLDKMISELASFKGKLKDSEEEFVKAVKLNEDLDILSYKVFRYPQLMLDLNSKDQFVSSKLQKVHILFSKFAIETSWIAPEILSIPKETVIQWIDANPELEPHRFDLMNMFRLQEHVLSEDKEKLLSFYSQFSSSPKSIYSQLSISDIKFKDVTLSDGEELKVTPANYSRVLATNKNQEDRKITFEALYSVYEEYKNTYAAIYNATIQGDWALAQARNYNSSLEAALEADNIPIEVYENLVETVKENTEPLKRYARLRKRILGLEEYHVYDGSIPIVDFDKKYDYAEATKWVLDSIKPLGEEYYQKMKKVIEGSWIDVFETEGKRSGAYSAGVYGVHPYMLLNYNETLDSVFTLAHELGHTMHTLLSSEYQPFATHDYTIFVAEVASTFNERLLLDYLLERTKDPKERIALLQQEIRNLIGTFYFQTLLADYELQVHRLVENGEAITSEVLGKITADLYYNYYGDTVEKDELLSVVWARIPHFFHSPFYVYQYATCFVSSAVIYDMVTNPEKSEPERKEALEKYLVLLKSGGNDYPMEQLKKAGVDLTQKETTLSLAKQLDDMLDLLEKEIEKIEK